MYDLIIESGTSKLIREVEGDEQVVVTRRGGPIARMTSEPAKKQDDPEWQAGYKRMVERMDKGYHLIGLRIERHELYDR